MYEMTQTSLDNLKPYLSSADIDDGIARYTPLDYHNIFINGEVVVEPVSMIEVSGNNVIFYGSEGIIDNGATIDNIECAVYKQTRMI